MVATPLAFLLSELAAFFLGLLANEGPFPISDRGPTGVEQTTQARGRSRLPQAIAGYPGHRLGHRAFERELCVPEPDNGLGLWELQTVERPEMR
jgi:hypothetical protein